MKTRQPLLVPDVRVDEEWKSNPDIKLGMISYMGFPIAWPDGEIFGTICVLDKNRNDYSDLYLEDLPQRVRGLRAVGRTCGRYEQRALADLTVGVTF